MKLTCPFCNEQLISATVPGGNHFISQKYNGIKYKSILSYGCRNALCEGTLKVSRGYRYYLDFNEQNEPIYTGLLFPMEDRTYAVDYIFPIVKSDINIILSIATKWNPKLNPTFSAKTCTYKPILEIKYPGSFDFNDPARWGEKALDKLLKLKAIY